MWVVSDYTLQAIILQSASQPTKLRSTETENPPINQSTLCLSCNMTWYFQNWQTGRLRLKHNYLKSEDTKYLKALQHSHTPHMLQRKNKPVKGSLIYSTYNQGTLLHLCQISMTYIISLKWCDLNQTLKQMNLDKALFHLGWKTERRMIHFCKEESAQCMVQACLAVSALAFPIPLLTALPPCTR